MTLVPHRTAVAQVANQLLEAIRAGTWRAWLPNERDLCRELQVSRSTLRLALERLAEAGVTQPQHGVGHRIVLRGRRAPRRSARSLGLLAPVPLAQLRPSTALWIDELKDLLHSAGYDLRYHCARSAYQPAPGRALQRLVRAEAHAGWLLVLSTEAMQRWLVEHEVPCLIAGSLFPGIALPSVDLDYRAIARHAAGVLLRAGHRRIALFNRRQRGAGEVESETGFLEAAQASRHPEVEAIVAHYDDSLASVASALRRLVEQKSRPTGLLVANSQIYLATVTELARRGLRLPADISVISRDDDPFLNFVLPAPARYLSDPHVFAAKLRTLALHLIERGAAPVQPIRIQPHFEAGGSVAAPRGGGRTED